jgi:hypothetical protein
MATRKADPAIAKIEGIGDVLRSQYSEAIALPTGGSREIAIAVGIHIAMRPRTKPDVRLSRIRLPPRVFDDQAASARRVVCGRHFRDGISGTAFPGQAFPGQRHFRDRHFRDRHFRDRRTNPHLSALQDRMNLAWRRRPKRPRPLIQTALD